MEIFKSYKDNILNINLKGIVNNSKVLELSLLLKDLPSLDTKAIIIDVLKLSYINKEGLDVLYALKQKVNIPFKIINVSLDIKKLLDEYKLFNEEEIKLLLRPIDINEANLIGKGSCGECYRIDDKTIVKLYYSNITNKQIEEEQELSKKAFILGIPTAISYDIVTYKERKGIIYELIKAKSLTELIRTDKENIDYYIDVYAKTCKKIHSFSIKDIILPSYKQIFKNWVLKISPEYDLYKGSLLKLIDKIDDSKTCIHGDLITNNIMLYNDEGIIIDMGEFSYGNYIFDLANILFSLKYVNAKQDYSDFYGLDTKTLNYILNELFKKYFNVNDINEIEKIANSKYIKPLAILRYITAYLRDDIDNSSKKEYANYLLLNELIPFINKNI